MGKPDSLDIPMEDTGLGALAEAVAGNAEENMEFEDVEREVRQIEAARYTKCKR